MLFRSLLSAFRTAHWSFGLGAVLLSAVVIAKNFQDAKLELLRRQEEEKTQIAENR